MFRFRMEVAGAAQLDRGIARFADGVADYRPIWGVITDDFYAQVRAQFSSEGAEGGDRWQQLSEEYAGWKEKHFPGKPILQRTGDLMESLTNPNSANAVHIEERKTLTLGSRVPYAIYHQTGTGKMAARPEIQLTDAFRRAAMKNIQVYLVQIATQSGFRAGLGPLEATTLGSLVQRNFSPGASLPRFLAGRAHHPPLPREHAHEGHEKRGGR
jgi:phage gpG-like protein